MIMQNLFLEIKFKKNRICHFYIADFSRNEYVQESPYHSACFKNYTKSKQSNSTLNCFKNHLRDSRFVLGEIIYNQLKFVKDAKVYEIILCDTKKREGNIFYPKNILSYSSLTKDLLIQVTDNEFINVKSEDLEVYYKERKISIKSHVEYQLYTIWNDQILYISSRIISGFCIYKYNTLPLPCDVFKYADEPKMPVETKKEDMNESSKNKKTIILTTEIRDRSSNQSVQTKIQQIKKAIPAQKTIVSSTKPNEEKDKVHTEIEKKWTELDELSDYETELSKQIEAKKKDLKNISNEYSKYDVEKTEIQSEIEKKQTELKTLSDSQADLSRQIEIKKQELEQLPEQYRTLSEKKAEIKAEVEKEQKDFEEQSEQHRKCAAELSKKCDELRREKEETEKEISEITAKITDTIARNSKIIPVVKAFFESISGRKAVISSYRQSNSDISNISVIKQFQHFVNNFSENLNEFIGYSSEDSLRLSQMLSFAIGNRLPVLLPANEEHIAECTAAMFNRPVKIINADIDVPASAYNEHLKDLEPSVLLVNSAFDALSAQYFNSLRYFSNNHILFFSIAGLEPALMPKAVFDKAIYVETNLRTSISNNKHLYFYRTDFSIFEQGNIKTDKQSDKLQNFAKCGIITYSAATYLARYLSYTDYSEIKKDIMLLNHLAICAVSAHRQKEFKEIIPEYRNYNSLLIKLQ